jgi:hypothetical protein
LKGLDNALQLLFGKQNGAAPAGDMQAGVFHHCVMEAGAGGLGGALE